MPSQLPVSEASPETLHCDTTARFLAQAIVRRLEDPDVTAVYANAQPQRIWTIDRARHSAG